MEPRLRLAPTVWGPYVWQLLHATSRFRGPSATYVSFIKCLPLVLPCPACQRSLARHLRGRAADSALRDALAQRHLGTWVHTLHKWVTHKLLRAQYREAGVPSQFHSALLRQADQCAVPSGVVKWRMELGGELYCPRLSVFMVLGLFFAAVHNPLCPGSTRERIARQCAVFKFCTLLCRVLKGADLHTDLIAPLQDLVGGHGPGAGRRQELVPLDPLLRDLCRACRVDAPRAALAFLTADR
jgi:hypothetical protein